MIPKQSCQSTVNVFQSELLQNQQIQILAVLQNLEVSWGNKICSWVTRFPEATYEERKENQNVSEMEKIKTVNTSFKIVQILFCSICREIVIESDEVWKVEFAIDQIEKPGETVGNIIIIINNVIVIIIGMQVNEDLLDLNTTIQNLLGDKNYPYQS